MPRGITTGLLGDAVTANVFLLGVAYQAGVVPVTAASIEQAIDLNGTAVELNTQAFRWGRLWVVDPNRVERQAGLRREPDGGTAGLEEFADDAELQRMLALRVSELVAYQDRRYAERYLDVVRRCRVAEKAAGTDGELTRTVAHQLHRLMAYKDEYEVARLLLAGRRAGGAHVRGSREGHLEPPPADAPGHGHEAQAPAGAVGAPGHGWACAR